MKAFWRKSGSGQNPADRLPRLGTGDGSVARFGWKAAALTRIRAAGAAAPDGFLLDADLIETVAAGGEVPRKALLAALSGLRRRAGARQVVLRLSPVTPLPDLAPPPVVEIGQGSAAEAAERFEDGLRAALAIWSGARAERRRRAVRASRRCALLVQAWIESDRAAARLRLYDPETGAPAPSGWITEPGQKGRALRPDAAPGSEDAVAIAAARAAEDALGEPLETEIAFSRDRAGAPSAWVLRAQPLRASAAARLRIAVAMAEADRVDRADALLMMAPQSLEELLHPSVDPQAERDRVALGLPASPGAVSGKLVFTAAAAEQLSREGEAAILARPETSPEDVHGVFSAAGVLTTRGGLTSHAALVARGLGRPCVVGASDARIDLEAQVLRAADGREFHAGDWLTIDGSAGEALAGRPALRRPEPTGDLARFMGWADIERRMSVRANADTPADAETAGRMGVDGIGLCRTEHMFVEPARVTVMREMILADNEAERRAALERLLPMQRADFVKLFEIMAKMPGSRFGDPERAMAPPVTIRLLDPPLHEFLPREPRAMAALAQALGQPVDKLARRAEELREFNPMLGKRGCRLGVAYPEIYEMQARAIFEAALEAQALTGLAQAPEIMIPLVSAVRELEFLKERIDAVAQAIRQERGATLDYGVGIMIETPRAALRAGPLGALSTFFSFGTNDLTQMTFGLSRDDAGRLMRDYVERGVFETDPFQHLDQEGVGELIQLAVERGRAANPGITIGLCGEHGGDPATVAFCAEAGFDYVSCSPFRAPIARLAAAQAEIRLKRGEPAAGG